MTSSIDAPPGSADPRPEAERQLAAAIARLKQLTRRILADADAWSQAPADLVDLHERLNSEWRSWRDVRNL